MPVGNQGNTDTHTEGIIEKVGDIKDIEIRVGEKQKNLPIIIWINKPCLLYTSMCEILPSSINGRWIALDDS